MAASIAVVLCLDLHKLEDMLETPRPLAHRGDQQGVFSKFPADVFFRRAVSDISSRNKIKPSAPSLKVL